MVRRRKEPLDSQDSRVLSFIQKLIAKNPNISQEKMAELMSNFFEVTQILERDRLGRLKDAAYRSEVLRGQLEGMPSSQTPSGDYFKDWEEGIRKLGDRYLIEAQAEITSLKNKLEEEKKQALIIAANSMEQEAVKIFSIDRKARKSPIGYYNQANRTFNYTPASLELLGVDESKIYGKMSWKGLLRLIMPSDRRGLYEAIRSGEPIFHHEAQSSGEPSRTLYLTTHPVKFGDRGIVGFVISLYDPKENSTYHKSLTERAGEVVRTLEERSTKLEGKQ